MRLFDAAHAALMSCEPSAKVAAVRRLQDAFRRTEVVRADAPPPVDIPVPGRPARPELVAPRQLAQRGLGTAEGRAALIHAVAHIEFNAINLALDAVYRFRDLPDDYYADWLRVAVDEARHFELLQARLADLGHAYGDFPAHDGLWEAACRTAHDGLTRMALVPRVLEARGLDVTPGMITRLREVGDDATVAVLEVILAEEVAHVAIGTRWFHHLCARSGRDPEPTFLALLRQHEVAIRPPFNRLARAQAGFSDAEQAGVEALVPARDR
ncbi:MAG TPA: ferritin-like domain-containing protein [Patescibacteria group bacterium]|nr:ferritin-like domain-containing protein [Patescibacteria group bacterium]